MVMVGTDVHKYNHCAQAVDEVGRPLSVCNVKATDAGHCDMVAWARREFADAEVTFAVEDCRQ